MQYTYNSSIFQISTSSKMVCLCTIIKNTSSSSVFVLVPQHGKTVAPNEQVVFVGGIAEWLQSKRYRTRNSVLRLFDASASNSAFNKCVIQQTPVPHLFNSGGTGNTKIIAISGGTDTFGIANPCWA